MSALLGKPSFEQVLDTCSELYVHDEGCSAVMPRSADIVRYTPREMEAFDPRIHQALLAVKRAASYTAFGILCVARLCVRHWSLAAPIIAVVDSGTVCVAHITGIVSIDEELRTVRIETDSYDVVSFDGFDNLAVPSMAQIYPVSFEWLNDYYPGSIERMRTAVDLGLSKTHLLNYVLRDESTEPAELPALSDNAINYKPE